MRIEEVGGNREGATVNCLRQLCFGDEKKMRFNRGIPVSLPKADLTGWGGDCNPSLLKSQQPLPELEVEVGVEALGTGEPLATIPIWFCWGDPTVQAPRLGSLTYA
ncbi:hypothetical protein E2C01_035668 [Portunus trituberculatus]|uniref:Uncharacterized protein n=1 Tax=Portunus trituberculatus TaxID=210409 RepID=A0A5B7F8Z3_PORTR|nr:hypothetical protein [Portunus trituberculatus]